MLQLFLWLIVDLLPFPSQEEMSKQPRAKEAEPVESDATVKPLMDGSAKPVEEDQPEEGEEEPEEVDAAVEIPASQKAPDID